MKKGRYDNGYGYRFNCLSVNKKIQRLIKTRNNSIYHYLKSKNKDDIISVNNIEVYIVTNPINILAICSEYNIFKSAMAIKWESYVDNKTYNVVIIDFMFFEKHNIDILPIMYHEIYHCIISNTIKDKSLSYIEEECMCDKYAAKAVGIDRVIDAYKKLATACNIHFSKPNGKIFKYRIDQLELLKNKGVENNEKKSTENTKKFLTEL